MIHAYEALLRLYPAIFRDSRAGVSRAGVHQDNLIDEAGQRIEAIGQEPFLVPDNQGR